MWVCAYILGCKGRCKEKCFDSYNFKGGGGVSVLECIVGFIFFSIVCK